MAGKPKPMSQVKQILRLYKDGYGKKSIASALGVSKNTIKGYLKKVVAQDKNIEDLLKMEDEALNRFFFAGNPAYKKDNYEELKALLPYYSEQLKQVGVTKMLLFEEYKQCHPTGYGKSQFCHHLLVYHRKKDPSMVLNHEPAKQLFVDFAGKSLHYVEQATGEQIACCVFVATLPYSDYCFAMAVPSQKSDDFLYALQCCFAHLGGVPKVLVPDNLKSAVNKTDKYEPDINRVMEDFANHYQTSVLPARAYKPKDKALVENSVRLIYNRVYAKLRHETFFDINSLNEAIMEKVKVHNQTRMQQKDYCREEKFLSDEKPLLAKLPETIFEKKHYKTLLVGKNNHIYLGVDRHYYSVPYLYIGQKAKVIYTRNMVSIYIEGKKVAQHVRVYRHGYSTCKEHLCSTHQHYIDRSPQYYREKALRYTEHVQQLIDYIFMQQKYPEQLYKTCEGIFALARNTNESRFDKACKLALEHQHYSYKFLLNILENNMVNLDHHSSEEDMPLPKHTNIRGNQYYQ